MSTNVLLMGLQLISGHLDTESISGQQNHFLENHVKELCR